MSKAQYVPGYQTILEAIHPHACVGPWMVHRINIHSNVAVALMPRCEIGTLKGVI